MKARYSKWIITTAVVAAFTGVMCGVVCAAPDSGATSINLELKDVEISTAIQALCKSAGRNFAIDQDVQGIVPAVSFKDVTFDQALKNLLKSAGLVYRVVDGIYVISKKSTTATTAGTPSTSTTDNTTPVDTTTTDETTIEKVPLSNTGATELLGMMNGNNSSSGMGGGMMGGMMGGMGGGMSGFGGGMSGFGGGMSGFGGGMSSGFGGGMSSFGGGMSSFGGSSYGGSSRRW